MASRKIYIVLTTLIVAVIFFSCAGEKGPKENPKEVEIFRLHDEVMPLMDSMKRERRRLIDHALEVHADSLAARKIAGDLKAADSLMWVWMYQYKRVDAISDSLDAAAIENYLDKQLIEVGEVNRRMKEGLRSASSLLESQ